MYFIFYRLSLGTVSELHGQRLYIAWDGRMTGKLVRIWKEAAVARPLPARTINYYGSSQSRKPEFLSRFEMNTSSQRYRYINTFGDANPVPTQSYIYINKMCSTYF
jgi:hypothetical protein